MRRFVEHGGGLLATGETSLCNEWGDVRADFGLADLFGAHTIEERSNDANRRKRTGERQHSYLRLMPELNQQDNTGVPAIPADSAAKRSVLRTTGETPALAGATPAVPSRHPVLRGFEETDILPFGGVVESVTVDSNAAVLLTFVPAFPVYPPETAWMRQPRTEIPGLILHERPGHGRVAFLPADLDQRFW